MLLNDDFMARWEQIVKDIDKAHCPISCVKKVIFRTNDRRQKTINLKNMRSQGIDDESIEMAVTRYIEEHEDSIASMELLLDVEAVAEIVQPETDKLLKNI
jgi:methionine salvage enolase-phosphatase E1